MTTDKTGINQEKQLLLLLEEALDQNAVDQQSWLEQHCPAELLPRALNLLVDANAVDENQDADITLVGAAAELLGNLTQSAVYAGDEEDEELEPGHVIKNRFVIQGLIGRGGMGLVYRAKDLRKEENQDSDPDVAVKVLGQRFRSNQLMIMALQREARKAQTLAHPNIATVYDFDRDEDLVFMTMELLQGDPLDRFIEKHPNGIDSQQAIPIIRGLCLGLAYAHNKNIIHSDFKPSNIFLTRGNATRILDFGIARASPASDSSEGEITTQFDAGTIGALTPTYASCEMFEGATPHPADDVYALAIVSYELLTGRHPFEYLSAAEAKRRGLTPKPIKGIKRREWRAIEHGLAFDRGNRTAHAAVFLSEFEGAAHIRKAVGALAATLVLTVGYLGYEESRKQLDNRPVIAFAQLPADQQAAFTGFMNEGGQFEQFGDYSAALQYYKNAYQTHPRNSAAVEAIEGLLQRLVANPDLINNNLQKQSLSENIALIRGIDEFLHNRPTLSDLAEQLQGVHASD
ncbi:MAG: serine/threonine protein kinase [Pseudomonadaceae bacterium]|nr:serine/threonine protein kinase [Pseudomonadaceae bacterium]